MCLACCLSFQFTTALFDAGGNGVGDADGSGGGSNGGGSGGECGEGCCMCLAC